MKSSYEHKKFWLVCLMGMLIFSLGGHAKSDAGQQSQPEGYPIASDILTTRLKTIMPGPRPLATILLDEVSKYKQYGYGDWKYGKGIDDGKRTDIMPAGYTGALSPEMQAKLAKLNESETPGRNIGTTRP